MSRTSEQHSRKAPSRFDSRGKRILRYLESVLKTVPRLPLRLMLRPRFLRAPIPVEALRSVLILRHDAIGDAVLTTPVWRLLKRAAPGLTIGVVGSRQNREFLELDSDVDHVYEVERSFSASVIRELLRARKVRYDLVLNLQFHDKSRGAIFCKIASPGAWSGTGVQRRTRKYTDLYSNAVEITDPTAPITIQYLEVLMGLVSLPIQTTRPTLKLRHPLPGNSVATPYIVIHCDCSQSYKDWGTHKYLALALELAERHPAISVCLSSGPRKAEEICNTLNTHQTERVRYVPTPKLTELLALLNDAMLVVSPDTSVVHFAGALGKPIVALYLEPSPFLPFSQTTSEVIFPQKGLRVSDIPCELVVSAAERILGEITSA